MKTLEQIKYSLLEIDRDDIERWLRGHYDDGKENYSFDCNEMRFGEELFYVTGYATITVQDFGGNDEPEYSEFTYEYDLTIETEFEEVKANFFSMYERPVLL